MPALQRAHGRARIGFRSTGDRNTRLTELFQEGCLKVRLPRPGTEGHTEALIINTAGGLTGGDALSVEVALDEGARATVTTPACERIYRSAGGEAVIQQRLQVGPGARLDWVPQETILFDQGRLRRRLDVHLEADAEITLCEAVLFGRAAMGETVRTGAFNEFWTIRRDGRLLYADALRLSEPFDRTMAGPATLGGHVAMASLIHVGRSPETRRDALRRGFSEAEGAWAGASVIGDILVARMVARDGLALRRALIPALDTLRDGRPLPRNWFC